MKRFLCVFSFYGLEGKIENCYKWVSVSADLLTSLSLEGKAVTALRAEFLRDRCEKKILHCWVLSQFYLKYIGIWNSIIVCFRYWKVSFSVNYYSFSVNYYSSFFSSARTWWQIKSWSQSITCSFQCRQKSILWTEKFLINVLLHLCKLANNYLYLNVSFREKGTIMFSSDLKNIYICVPFCNIEEVIIFSILLIGKPFHILVWLLLLREKLQFEENLFPELQLFTGWLFIIFFTTI